jgi:hypothetical protein
MITVKQNSLFLLVTWLIWKQGRLELFVSLPLHLHHCFDSLTHVSRVCNVRASSKCLASSCNSVVLKKKYIVLYLIQRYTPPAHSQKNSMMAVL